MGVPDYVLDGIYRGLKAANGILTLRLGEAAVELHGEPQVNGPGHLNNLSHCVMAFAPQVFRCDELEFTMATMNGTERFLSQYGPVCQAGGPAAVVPVLAHWGFYEQIASALRWSFGGSLWFSLMLHVLGVEYYVGYLAGLCGVA